MRAWNDSPQQGTLEFVYPQAKAAINDGRTFSVNGSDDLVTPNWNTVGVTQVDIDKGRTIKHVKASVSAGENGRNDSFPYR